MAKIDINLTTSVDISVREGDTFQLDLGITKEDGTDFSFENDAIIFSVYGSGGVPVMLLNSGSVPHYITSSSPSGFVSASMLQKARAISNLLDFDINLLTFIDYDSYIIPRYLNSASGLTTSIYNVQQIEGGIRLIVQSHAFNLPQGSYSYELKVASDLVDVLKGVSYDTNNIVDSYFKNSSTWMEGKFIVNKN